MAKSLFSLISESPQDAIKDILGVDKKTLKYYIKATEERKKKVLFKYVKR
jgi:hypothetical protein